jgi:hypothetical protein
LCEIDAKERSTTYSARQHLKISVAPEQLLQVDVPSLLEPLLCSHPQYLLGFKLWRAMDDLHAQTQLLLRPLLTVLRSWVEAIINYFLAFSDHLRFVTIHEEVGSV